MEFVAHVSDDDLEGYAMRSLPAAESEPLEDHLLNCAECRERLPSTDEYVAAMKAAAGTNRRERNRRTGALWPSPAVVGTPGWCGGILRLLCAVAVGHCRAAPVLQKLLFSSAWAGHFRSV